MAIKIKGFTKSADQLHVILLIAIAMLTIASMEFWKSFILASVIIFGRELQNKLDPRKKLFDWNDVKLGYIGYAIGAAFMYLAFYLTGGNL